MDKFKKFSGIKTCSECYEHAPLKYEKLVELFVANECIVLTTEEEYKDFNTSKDKILYIASCGHEKSISLNESSLKEIKYRLIREDKIKYMIFEYPIIQCQNFDFIVNGFKVQEKLLVFDKINNSSLTSNLSKSIGKHKGKGPYEEGDNNFYWYHKQESSKFYIIPEKVLINDGYIKSSKFPSKTKMLFYPDLSLEKAREIGYKTCEYNKYLFCYDNDDVIKIKELFNIV